MCCHRCTPPLVCTCRLVDVDCPTAHRCCPRGDSRLCTRSDVLRPSRENCQRIFGCWRMIDRAGRSVVGVCIVYLIRLFLVANPSLLPRLFIIRSCGHLQRLLAQNDSPVHSPPPPCGPQGCPGRRGAAVGRHSLFMSIVCLGGQRHRPSMQLAPPLQAGPPAVHGVAGEGLPRMTQCLFSGSVRFCGFKILRLDKTKTNKKVFHKCTQCERQSDSVGTHKEVHRSMSRPDIFDQRRRIRTDLLQCRCL